MWWDERAPGGRVKGLLYLLHPGPSLLVTAVFVAAAGLAGGGLSAVRGLQLAGVMLPIQFSIGVSNDLFDVEADRRAKAWKALVRGIVPTWVAVVLAVVFGVLGLVVAGTVSWTVFGLAVAGLAAGLAYDAGLRRTVLSVVPWWAAFVVLPLAAYAAAGRSVRWAGVLVGLAGVLAFALHLANGLPDVGEDRASGRAGLPALLGARWARVGALAGMAADAVVAIDVAGPLGQRVGVVAIGAAIALVVVGVALLAPGRWLFPLLAPAGAALAVTWLAALPGG